MAIHLIRVQPDGPDRAVGDNIYGVRILLELVSIDTSSDGTSPIDCISWKTERSSGLLAPPRPRDYDSFRDYIMSKWRPITTWYGPSLLTALAWAIYNHKLSPRTQPPQRPGYMDMKVYYCTDYGSIIRATDGKSIFIPELEENSSAWDELVSKIFVTSEAFESDSEDDVE